VGSAATSSGLTISKAPTRAGDAIARQLNVLLADSDADFFNIRVWMCEVSVAHF